MEKNKELSEDIKQAYSELYISEARYRGIVEDQTELICRTTKDDKITFVNTAYCRFFKKTQEELLDHNFFPLIPEEDKAIISNIKKEISKKNPFTTIEHRILTNKGEIKWLQWIMRGLFDEKDELMEYQSVGRDVTERKEYEEKMRIYLNTLEARTAELERSKFELELANKKHMSMIDELKKKEEQLIRSEKLAIIGEFAGGITHEIKNPLGAIITNVQLMRNDIITLKEKCDVEEVSEISSSAEIIELAAKQAKDIITSLLAYTKIEETKYKKVDLNNIVNTSLLLLKKELTSLGINLTTELGSDVFISGKSGELTQVLLNIIINAKDALVEKVSTNKYIKIMTYATNREAFIVIEDNGIGIVEDEKQKIFEPFFTTKKHGTGLGMSVSNTILKKHEATINIESELNEWTRFTVCFKRYEEKIG